MWIVLLDHSGSMGDSFEATKNEDLGRVRIIDAKIKLDAAKKSFLLELHRLPDSIQIVLLGFTSTVTEIHSGLASDVDQFESRINQLKPNNGTDIASALNYVIRYAQQRPQILLITDGKSDLGAARREAHNCADAGIRVDVLMIDPTDEGLEMAKAIAGITHGRWDPVDSADNLAERTSEIGNTRAVDLAKAETILRKAEVEYNALETSALDQARVSFSAGYPSRIDGHLKYPLIVYIHIDTLKEEIERYLKKEFAASGIVPTCSNATTATRIPRRTLITVQPNIPGILANPPYQEIIWLEDYHKLNFEVRYSELSEKSTSCIGFIDILADGVFISHIPVSITVDMDVQSTSETLPLTVTRNPFARIFASYAHTDDAVVQACKETYKALGIHLYVDRDDLLSGQPWRQTLQQLITKSDLFQLYWSQPAADSSEVANEWQLALVVSQSHTGDFIRPLYWQKPLPKLPNELQHLHFAFLDINKLHAAPKQEKDDVNIPLAKRRISNAIFPVIPLAMDDSSESIAIIQESIGCVIAFLEHVTGLRYYPPLTLLVEDYIIATIHNYISVDKGTRDCPLKDDIKFALEILQSLALEFHIGKFDPKDLREENHLKDFYHLNSNMEWNNFRHVRTLCEAIFSNPVTKYLEGKDPFEHPSTRYPIEKIIKEEESEVWLRGEVGHMYAVASENGKEKIKQIVGESELAEILDRKSQLSKSQVKQYAQRIRSQDYLTITNKYRTAFFDLFSEYETIFMHCNNFSDYLDKWFEYWLQYIDAYQSQNKVLIESSYSVSRPALNWLKSRYPNINFSIRSQVENRYNRGKPVMCTWTISAYDIYKTVSLLRQIIVDAVGSTGLASNKIRKYFFDTASSYGIFVSANSERATQLLLAFARDRNWPIGIALAGNHKVLLCTKAFDRYKAALKDLDLDSQQADQVARWFLIAIVVHEHTHAILATGIDKQGIVSWAANNWDEWQRGGRLNESLATWVEQHFFRDNQTMFDNITEYIHSGSYPEWPYEGAAKIEAIYKDKGLPGVRSLIKRLREDPSFAQDEFDRLPWPTDND